MRLTGTMTYDAPLEAVYALFTDPEALRSATPGLRSLREVGPDRWEADIQAGLGGFGVLYTGTIAVHDRRPGEGYRLLISGRSAHSAVRAEVRLSFEPAETGGTRVAYEADLSFEGAQQLSPAIVRGTASFFFHGMKEYLRRRGKTVAGGDGH